MLANPYLESYNDTHRQKLTFEEKQEFDNRNRLWQKMMANSFYEASSYDSYIFYWPEKKIIEETDKNIEESINMTKYISKSII